MASFNKVILAGNLTRDPEVKYIASGSAVCNVDMAVNRKYKTGDGELKKEVCYVKVTVWGKRAENCGEYLHKGSSVFVEGRLHLDQWEKDGQKFNRLTVVAENVQFLSMDKRPTTVPATAEEAQGGCDDGDGMPF